MQYFAEFHKISNTEDRDWFNPRLDRDTELFIDPFFVFKTELPNFKNSRNTFIRFFDLAFQLAARARKSKSAYKKLQNMLKFPEVSEICLGFTSSSVSGSGAGGSFSKIFADAIIDLVSSGIHELRHFEEVEIFTIGIGQDRISDTTANIIKRELVEYTQNICKSFNIPMKSFLISNAEFDPEYLRWEDKVFSLPENPVYSKRAVLLVPASFLGANHAINSEGFKNFINKNQELRDDLNYELNQLYTKTSVIEFAKKHPEWIDKYIEFIEKDSNVSPYDLDVDEKSLYQLDKQAFTFTTSNPVQLSAESSNDFLKTINLMIEQYRIFVEDNDGYKLLWNEKNIDLKSESAQINSKEESQTESHEHNEESRKNETAKLERSKDNKPKPKHEKAAQALLTAIVISYCQANNIDLSREVNIGRGPVDFKFSSGYKDRALIEIKLASNKKLKHGLEKQLPKYLQSEQIEYGYYLIIVHRKKEFEKVKDLNEFVDSLSKIHKLKLKVIVIDATLDKPSASVI